mgnify:CR=1 FL=1
MNDLIQQIEALTGPDREVDLAILNAIGRGQWRWLDRDRETITKDKYGPGAPGNPVCSLEKYTSSVDDAMTLVPEEDSSNFELSLEQSKRRKRTFWTAIVGHIHYDAWVLDCPTPALAICAAALKAREYTGHSASSDSGRGTK